MSLRAKRSNLRVCIRVCKRWLRRKAPRNDSILEQLFNNRYKKLLGANLQQHQIVAVLSLSE
jgi:hypothetical protein